MTSMTGVDLFGDVRDRLSMTIRRRKSMTNLRTGWILASASTPQAHNTDRPQDAVYLLPITS